MLGRTSSLPLIRSCSQVPATELHHFHGRTLLSNITARAVEHQWCRARGVTGINKVYDATNTATVNVLLSGVQAPDVITATAPATFNNKNVGTGKTVTVAANTAISYTGIELSNYTIVANTGGAIRTTTANFTPSR